MTKNSRLHKRIKVALIVLVSVVAFAILMHLTANYFIPFIKNMHNNGGAY